MVTFEQKVKKHNKKVSDAFKRARKGDTIDLTELMISKEKLLLSEPKKKKRKK